MKLKKGDNVKITAGKDAGKTGKVLSVNKLLGKVLVDGVNLYKKRKRPKQEGEKGELILVPRPLSISNLRFLCGSCGRPVRLGMRLEGGKKFRVCKKCQAAV